MEGFLNVDLFPGAGVDQIVDLEQPLPFEHESFDLVFADNVFEHIKAYIPLLKECNRILRPTGRLVIDVPYFRSAGAFIDPTHVNFFTLRSMRYFVPATYESTNYSYLPLLFRSVELIVNPRHKTVLNASKSLVANARPEWIEDTAAHSLLSIESIRFVLSK